MGMSQQPLQGPHDLNLSAGEERLLDSNRSGLARGGAWTSGHGSVSDLIRSIISWGFPLGQKSTM